MLLRGGPCDFEDEGVSKERSACRPSGVAFTRRHPARREPSARGFPTGSPVSPSSESRRLDRGSAGEPSLIAEGREAKRS